jgi:hypothetical protein
MEIFDNIELRSEKTQKAINSTPQGFIRYGTYIISLITIALFAISYFIPYYENIKIDVMVEEINGEVQINGLIPYSYINIIHENINAEIEFEGYSSADFGYTTAVITHIDRNIKNKSGHNFFGVILKVKRDSCQIKLTDKMNGSAYILISNKSILQRLLGI